MDSQKLSVSQLISEPAVKDNKPVFHTLAWINKILQKLQTSWAIHWAVKQEQRTECAQKIFLQMKRINLKSSCDLSDSVEVSSDCNSCCAKASLLCRPCVCLYAANCGPEQSRRGLAPINSDAEPCKAPNLSHQQPLQSCHCLRTQLELAVISCFYYT